MILAFSARAWEDYQHWVAKDRNMLTRVNKVIADTLRDPYAGIGKPEKLVGDFAGCLSRRINDEHRLVYEVLDDTYLVVHQARHHY
ncbi:MAG: Txe/YoeB family addiction module toxin [Sporichthyaceae bacterium]